MCAIRKKDWNRGVDESNPIQLNLPPTANVRWCNLYEITDPYWRDEDMVWIQMPNGISIDVGYYGHEYKFPDRRKPYPYRVQVIKDQKKCNRGWDKPICQVKTRSVQHVKKVIEDLALKYA